MSRDAVNATDPFEADLMDYYEAVIVYCRVEGCEWRETTQWGDLDEAMERGRAHYAAVHDL